MTMRTLFIGGAAALTLACGSSTPTPTGPTEVTLTTQTFAGSLATGASRFYSFRVDAGGTVSLMLASVTSQTDGTVLAHPLEIGVGVPAGTGCSVSIAKSSAPGLVTQLLTSANPGVHCVRVSDTLGLPEPVNFSLRFTHP